MEKDRNEKQPEETAKEKTRDLFDIARKLPEKQRNTLEGIIMGMQLATAEKAG